MWHYNDSRNIIILDDKPKKCKKITGTRLGAILGYNAWNTPFQMWCEMTKCAVVPFEGNKYTEAGIAIEPKQIDYVGRYLESTVAEPEEYFGADWLPAYKYQGFFPDNPVFDGKWDCAVLDEDGLLTSLVECKTTKRMIDWTDGKVPTYYAIQQAMYARLVGVEWFYIIVSFLQDSDYDMPHKFVPNNMNSKVFAFNINEFEVDGKSIDDLMREAEEFYNVHVLTGISPVFDEKLDKEYLDILRTKTPENDHELEELVEQLSTVNSQISEYESDEAYANLKKLKKTLETSVKNGMIELFGENDMKVQLASANVSKSVRKSLNTDKLLQYMTEEELDSCYDFTDSYTLKVKN